MVNLIGLLGNSCAYTLHSHTEFCDGRAQMEAFAREAMCRGFTHYGFTPHSPVPVESPCNMHRDKVPRYLAEVERIREEYPQVKWLCGMEIDYLGRETGWGPANPYFSTLPLDYSIGSVHFIPAQSGRWIDVDGRPERFVDNMGRHFDGDIEYVVSTFYAQSQAMVAEGGFDIIGHFDKIGLNASFYQPDIEEKKWYLTLVNDLIDSIIASGLTVEINTKAFAASSRFFPHERYWRRLVEARVPIVINSDAHVPALINASRDIAYERLRSL